MKSSKPGNKAQRNVEYKNYHMKTMRRNYYRKLSGEIITENYQEILLQKIIRRNYYRKLSGEIITENYQLVYQSGGKCEIYRDTGVSKNSIKGVRL